MWGTSSFGRALPWHGRGEEFESPVLHHFCYYRSMKKIETCKSSLLLWLSLLIFTFETVGIITYYWLNGYSGVTNLTISKFVGLNLWSSLIFGAGNALIVILMLYYLSAHARIKNSLWHLLMVLYLASFVALSIFPHVPEPGTLSEIHQFFSAAMFILMLLLGVLSLIIAKHKSGTIIATLFTTFSVYFIISYILRPDYFMGNILWFESAYIYAFFALLISSNSKKLDA